MRKRKMVLTPKLRTKVRVTVLTDGNASVAHAEFFGFTKETVLIFETTGAAKREQGDPRDQVIAVELAVGRALARMAGQMIRAGNRRVQEATDEQRVIREKRHRKNGKNRDGKNRDGRHPGKLLALDVIREKYGAAAADRAAARRAHSI